MTTPHQTENHYFEVDREDTGLKFEGYENATDEEKTKMMLQIAKEANAEQKAMFEPEKQPWTDELEQNLIVLGLNDANRLFMHYWVNLRLKKERECLCKDKGVIELIEEAVEAERARLKPFVERIRLDVDVIICDCGEPYKDSDLDGSLKELEDALQVINKEGDKS